MAGKAGGRRLVIVESPTKANKIASFLGDGYIVQSSRGHIRDLPTGAAEVPAKYKGEKWARTGVNVDNGFEAIYVVSPEKRATLRTLKEALVGADELLLATDGDREGEAIAWHLLQELKPKVPAKRMVFHEITPTAIAEAVANPRDLDEDLVDAQETRRILDRLYGYEVSPVLWKKVMPRLSAGRVQSVATRLIVDRERERIAFRSASYWDLDAILDAGSDAQPPLFPARLTRVGERRVAQGRDFDSRGTLIVKDNDQLSAWMRRRRRPWPTRCVPPPLPSTASSPSLTPAARTHPSGRRRCSKRRVASSASPPNERCRSHRTCTRPDSLPICVRIRSRCRVPRLPQPGSKSAALRRGLPAGPAAHLHLQGQECARSARGDPPGR